MARPLNLALPLAGAVLLSSLAIGQISTYTEASLGYPVPTPVESTQPVIGFRTYNSLHLRHQELVLAHSFIQEVQVGTSRELRPIYGYVLGDADDIGVDGTTEGGALINGTIHAREWGSPEILTQTMEWFANNYDTDPVARYLVDQNRLAFIPVLNVDGFLQTQRTPSQYIGSSDGRMRRKNMRDVDDLLATTADASNGVDCNRNLSEGFGGGSASPTSESYRGPSAFSEPETQALRDFISAFQSPGQLRFFADIHGAIPALYAVYTADPEADQVTATMVTRLQRAFRARNGVSDSYGEIPVNPGEYIGATDEYHGATYTIPSFTVEYPTPHYRTGGFGPAFILPDAELPEVVDENFHAIILGFLYASGPPILEKGVVWRDADDDHNLDANEVASRVSWNPTTPGGSSRTMTLETPGALEFGGAYNVLLQFNRPMRVADSEGNPANWPGQVASIEPSATVRVSMADASTSTVAALAPSTGWMSTPEAGSVPGYRRYKFDTWQGTLDLSSFTPGLAQPQSSRLHVSVRDLYGHDLDGRPATVADFVGGWTGFENENGIGALGGADENLALQLAEPASARVEGWQLF